MSTVVVRPRNQITIPQEIVSQLNIEPGETLAVKVENGVVILELQGSDSWIDSDVEREITAAFAEPAHDRTYFDNVDDMLVGLKK